MQRALPVTHFMQLPTGRKLAYCEYGDRAGKPVFYFHGTPGSRLEPQLGEEAAHGQGCHIIALDRPGVGRSDPAPGRSLLDWPRDVLATAAERGFDRFGLIGVSGGGPYALACAHAIPERLDFTVLIGSWAPVAEEPDLWKAMAPLDRFFGKLSGKASWVFTLPFSTIGLAARWLSPQGFVSAMDSSMSDADRTLMQDDVMARFFAEDIREAFQQGVRGPAEDALLLYREWGFSLADIPVEVLLFHGTEDTFAPYSYAQYLNDALPRSQLHTYPGEGHLTMLRRFEDVFRLALQHA